MKISAINVYLLRRDLNSTMRISRGGFTTRRHAIVEVVTDEGVSGLGEGVGDAELIAGIIRSLGDRVIGLDPCNIELMRKHLIDAGVYFERMGSVLCAASAIEIACWDIKGKVLNRPVYELLGGKLHNKVAAYASDVYWEHEAERMAENARRIVDLGFKAIKVHVGVKSPREECCRLAAVRRAIGDDIELMVDLNAGYSRPDAALALDIWREFRLFWLEEPLHPEDVEGLAELRKKSHTPIAAGENVFRVHGFKRLFDADAVDYAMPDIGRVGGLMETRNICILAGACGVIVSPHNFSSGILLAATLQIMASTPGAALLEIDTSGNAVYEDLLVSPLVIQDGMVHLPEMPGLGVALKHDTLERYAS